MKKPNQDIFVNLLQIIKKLDDMKVATIVTDRDKKIINMNKMAEELTGWSLSNCFGIDVQNVLNISEENNVSILTFRDTRKTDVYLQTFPCENTKSDVYYVTFIRRNTDNTINNKILAISEKNLRVIFESAYDAIIVHDLQGNIIDVNKQMLEMYSSNFDDIIGKASIKDLSDSNNPFDNLPEIWERVSKGESQIFEWKAKSLGNERNFDVEVYLTKISLHHQDAILATIRDISEKKKSEQMIRYLSFHDKLTGLYNRAFFEEELRRLDTNRNLPLCIIIGDINGLKLTNDAFGHLAGDELLKLVGKVLKKASRKEDIVARWGGDEFAIILPNATGEIASKVCERIQNECTRAESKPIALSIALGYSTKTETKQDIFDIIKEAETAMYTNKLKEGKENRKRIFNSLLEKQEEWSHNIELTTKLFIELARAYCLKESFIEKFKLLASIYDIGKASIPREILLKPDNLTEEEWEIAKKHSEVGYRIVSTYPEYAHIAEELLAHHERWDGEGYPRKLKGNDIPVVARILSIIDAYDVIISGRPYRAALEHKDALKEIKSNSGSQFDPKLVELFINMDFSIL